MRAVVSNMLPKNLLDQMVRRKTPPSLEELAFDTISTVVSSIMQHILFTQCTKKTRTSDFTEEVEMVTMDLNMLEHHLHSSLPRVFAAKMTSYLLKGIVTIIDKTKCSVDGFKTTGDDKCRAVISQFILISINPYLRRLNISRQSHIVKQVILKNLNKMSKLEMLSVKAYYKWDESKDVILRNLGSLENLIFFTMEQDCTDEIVTVLGQNCKKLKSLILNGSTKLTDNCISSLLELQDLQHLELCATSISEGGYIRLFTEMGKNRNVNADEISHGTPLKMVACSFIRNVMLEILVTYYPNLRMVSLSSLHCDLSLLKNLKCLQQLKLTGGHFLTDNIKGLIQAKGSSLHLLEFFLIQDVDLNWLGKYCTKLKKLNIRSCSINTGIPLYERSSEVIAFQKVEELVFYVQCSVEYIYFLLVNCINIRKVTVGLIKEISDGFIADVISHNPMKQLEEFKVYFSDDLTLCTVYLLMTNCPCLSCLAGLETWGGISQLELWRFRSELKQHNINIAIVKNC